MCIPAISLKHQNQSESNEVSSISGTAALTVIITIGVCELLAGLQSERGLIIGLDYTRLGDIPFCFN